MSFNRTFKSPAHLSRGTDRPFARTEHLSLARRKLIFPSLSQPSRHPSIMLPHRKRTPPPHLPSKTQPLRAFSPILPSIVHRNRPRVSSGINEEWMITTQCKSAANTDPIHLITASTRRAPKKLPTRKFPAAQQHEICQTFRSGRHSPRAVIREKIAEQHFNTKILPDKQVQAPPMLKTIRQRSSGRRANTMSGIALMKRNPSY